MAKKTGPCAKCKRLLAILNDLERDLKGAHRKQSQRIVAEGRVLANCAMAMDVVGKLKQVK